MCMETEHKLFTRVLITASLAACLLFCLIGRGLSPVFAEPDDKPDRVFDKAVVITCKGMIDDGLFQSIKRRTDEALASGATYIILEIGTYGGLVKSADDIYKHFVQNVNSKARTVAFVDTEAISAGAFISVACNDIIMRPATRIGACAPIMMGGELEGVEREKTESVIRASFRNAAEVNHYPSAVLESMVTQSIEVHRILNKETGEYEYFKNDELPTDDTKYDLEADEIIVEGDELLTLIASDAVKYGVARTTAETVDDALTFLEDRDGVKFSRPPARYDTNWSEQLVRWINSPQIMGVLVLLAMLGVYMELSTPGLGLPGLVAVSAVVIIVGSKFIIGMANWVEIALFMLGILLLLMELFVIPGFGLAGIAGIFLIIVGMFGMLVKNTPDQIPWPTTDFEWDILAQSLVWMFAGMGGSIIIAWLLAKYLPRVEFLSGLCLKPAFTANDSPKTVPMTSCRQTSINVGDTGIVTSPLRPSGTARFGSAVVDVITRAEFMQNGTNVQITEIHGNRIVVKKVE